jgi:mRNA interferase HigB
VRVHLIKRETIENYCYFNARSRCSFEEFLAKLKYADWQIPADMGNTFSKADILGKGSHRVVFNLGGNNYRMICKYAFGESQVHLFICWIGTHAEYSQLCQNGHQYTTNIY